MKQKQQCAQSRTPRDSHESAFRLTSRYFLSKRKIVVFAIVIWFAATFEEVCILAHPDDSFPIFEKSSMLKLEAVCKTDL